MEERDEISPHYDPMIAKLIAHGRDRDQARSRLSHGLAQVEIAGPAANAGFLRAMVEHPAFAGGDVGDDGAAVDGRDGSGGAGGNEDGDRAAVVAVAADAHHRLRAAARGDRRIERGNEVAKLIFAGDPAGTGQRGGHQGGQEQQQ